MPKLAHYLNCFPQTHGSRGLDFTAKPFRADPTRGFFAASYRCLVRPQGSWVFRSRDRDWAQCGQVSRRNVSKSQDWRVSYVTFKTDARCLGAERGPTRRSSFKLARSFSVKDLAHKAHKYVTRERVAMGFQMTAGTSYFALTGFKLQRQHCCFFKSRPSRFRPL
jgi:hypothetical protein